MKRRRSSAAAVSGVAPARPPLTRTDLWLLLMVVIWALNFSVIKVALAEVPPLAFNALRFPLASLAVFLVLRSRGPIPMPAASDLRRILVLGILGNVLYQLFFINGMARTRASNASLLLAGTPILTALLSAAVGHERVGRVVWVGVIATVVGLVMVVLAGTRVELSGATLTGDLLMLGACVSWATYTVGARVPIHRYGSVAITAWTLWIGTAGIVLVGLPELLTMPWEGVSIGAWLAVVYAGVLGIALAYLIWYHGVGDIGNTRTAVYSNLVPVLAVTIAWLWLGEVPTFWQILGAVVIIGGVTLTRVRP